MDGLRRSTVVALTLLAATRTFAQQKRVEAPRRFRWLNITVRQDRPPGLPADDRRPHAPAVTDSRAATATTGNTNARVTRTQVGDTIRVREGERAPIRFETAVPMTFRHFAIGARGPDEVRATVTYDAVVEFMVRPRVQGRAVVLEIEPAEGPVLTGARERGRLLMTAQGGLGDWIPVAGADLRDDSRTTASDGTLRAKTRPATNQRGVWLKVELEPEAAR
jgi:hypothetical protein